MEKQHVIISPHCDDEVIGNFEILSNNKCIVIYTEETTPERKQEALKLKDYFNVSAQVFLKSIPPTFINKNTILYMPDPYFEVHPSHRLIGYEGERILRDGYEVIFYSINMNAPYIREVKEPNKKEDILNKVYPSQSDLWKFEKKYILFEGRCKWIK